MGVSYKRRRDYYIATQAYKSLATLNPSYINDRFSRVGEDTTLRRSERPVPGLAQILHCNFLRPENADHSFERAATDLINGFNDSVFEMRELYAFKRKIYQVFLERDTQDWKNLVVREGIIV